MKKITVLSLLVIGISALSGCSLYGGAQNNTSNSAARPAPVQVAPAAADTVNIQNFSFNPATLTVKKGAAVTWTNNDSAPHQIKSAAFNSELMSQGQTFSFTFNDAGTFDYSCSIHPSMTGKIIVE